jgi:hypothetical protein
MLDDNEPFYESAADSMRAHWAQMNDWRRYREAEFIKPLLAAFIGEYLDMQTLKFNDTETTEGYEKLEHVLISAYKQAASGKGHARHNLGGDIPFHKQRMQSISQMINSPLGMVFQAVKKITEGINLPTHEARVNEMLGGINYLAGIVTYLNEIENTKFASNVSYATGGIASAAPIPGVVGDKGEYVIPEKAVAPSEFTRADMNEAATDYRSMFGVDATKKIVALFAINSDRLCHVPEASVQALTKVFHVLLNDKVGAGVDV